MSCWLGAGGRDSTPTDAAFDWRGGRKYYCDKMRTSPQLVVVEWEDSTQPTSPWQWIADIKADAPKLCVTVGFLVHDTPEVKVLAQNLGDVAGAAVQGSGVITIPT